MKNLICGLILAAAWLPAHAALNVLGCEAEWASLATEMGGDKVNASSATTGLQDPHRIEARPSLIARVRNADGDTTAVLFLEDIIEELIGEVQDATRRRA